MSTSPWRLPLALVSAAALLLAWDASGLDLAVSRSFAGPQGFAWRDAWWASTVLHDGARWVAGAALLAMMVDVAWPIFKGPPRAERAWALCLVLLCLLAVPALKRLSATSCPWDMAEFGGMAQRVSHWRLGMSDGGPGHCFPSGHAVSALAFLGAWAPLRARGSRHATTVLLLVCLAGLVVGAAQILRGAHFVSHVLWSAWACFALALGVQGLRGLVQPGSSDA